MNHKVKFLARPISAIKDNEMRQEKKSFASFRFSSRLTESRAHSVFARSRMIWSIANEVGVCVVLCAMRHIAMMISFIFSAFLPSALLSCVNTTIFSQAAMFSLDIFSVRISSILFASISLIALFFCIFILLFTVIMIHVCFCFGNFIRNKTQCRKLRYDDDTQLFLECVLCEPQRMLYLFLIFLFFSAFDRNDETHALIVTSSWRLNSELENDETNSVLYLFRENELRAPEFCVLFCFCV